MSLQLLILKERQLDIVDIHFSLEVLPHYHHRNFFFFCERRFYIVSQKSNWVRKTIYVSRIVFIAQTLLLQVTIFPEIKVSQTTKLFALMKD